MKKTYITPALNAVIIDKILMDSTSPSIPKVDDGGGTDNQWSNKYQGPAGGFLWEDDNNVTE